MADEFRDPREEEIKNETEGSKSKLNDGLGGLPEAVAELRSFREAYGKEPTTEYRAAIRFAEISVIQMAESLIDRVTP